jgi:hypothetical protein
MVEGMQVPLEDTFATIVESDLRERGLPVEMINAGVSGFGTDNELLFFRAEGVRYAPDLVVLVFNVVTTSPTTRALNARVYGAAPRPPKTYFHGCCGPNTRRATAGPADDPSVEHSLVASDRGSGVPVRALGRLRSRPAPPASRSPADLYDVMKPIPDPEWSEA